MKFLFYDVETANPKRSSICAVGWCAVEGLNIISKGYSLINPKAEFSPLCIAIHGITPELVVNAPTFEQYWQEQLKDLMLQCIVVAHNATSMDICATERALSEVGIRNVVIEYFDFLQVSQALLPELNRHKLTNLAEWAGIPFRHHQAEQDACTLFEIAKTICQHKNYESLEEMFIHSKCVMRDTLNSNAVGYEMCEERLQSQTEDYANPFANQKRYDGPIVQIDDALLGCSFCITGDLPIERSEAERKILERGGKFRTSVSTKTSFLVVGQYLDSGDGYQSSKQRKAIELIEHGVPIQIISPDLFLEILDSPETNTLIRTLREAELKKKEMEEEKERHKFEKNKEREKRRAEQAMKAKNEKPIVTGISQFSQSGELVAEYESITKASAATGINSKCIRDAAKGIQKTAGGFVWKFCR